MATAGAKETYCNLVNVEPMIIEKANLYPTGLFVSGDMLMLTDRNEWKVWLYRHRDGKLLAVSDRLESEPRGICRINSMQICVTLGNNIEIMSVHYTGDTGVITRCMTLHVNTPFDYCSRVVKCVDNIVVCGRKPDYSLCWCVVSLTDGHVDSIHQVCKGSWSHLTTKHNMVYISCMASRDSPDTGVYRYDIQNPCKQPVVYQHKELKWPMGITVDTMGFIFVCNYFPPCIHYFTNECEPVTIFKEGMPESRLYDIFWDQGLLYATCEWSNIITRYKTEYSVQEVLPPEILNMDDSFQKLYRKVLAIGKEKVYNIRVMIVGNQGVGKTSLTRRLLGEQVKENETESTEGIEVHSRCCQIDHATGKWERKIETDEIFLNDQRIASMLHKYISPQSKQDLKANDPENGISSTQSKQDLKANDPENGISSTQSMQDLKANDPENGISSTQSKQDLKANDPENGISSTQSKQDLKANDPENDISSTQNQGLDLQTAVSSPLDADKESICNKTTVCQISKEAGNIAESEEGVVPGSQVDKEKQMGNGLNEAEKRTSPKEIKHFLEKAQSFTIPKSMSSDVTLLDFAGQSLFYTIHQAFMSWRTLYILVTDMSLQLTDVVEEGAYGIDVSGKKTCNIQEYVTYWLNSIHSHVLIPEDDMMGRKEKKTGREEKIGCVQASTGNQPFVILVGTHSDKVPKESLDQRKESYFNDIRIVLKNSPLLLHLVEEDFAISNLGSDSNINALKSKIFEIAQKQIYWGEEIPARWIPLSRALAELRNGGIRVMDYADVERLNETLQVRIEWPEELDLFLRFEHDLGNIVFFNTERLKKNVVLDPKWLINGVRIWITSDQVVKNHPELSKQWFAFKETGRLTSTLIEKLWSSHAEYHQNIQYLLDVMEKLCIIAKPLQKEAEDFYWIPCMVSTPAPNDKKKLKEYKETNKTSTLCFRSKANFIHVGVFHRLLATCLSKWAPAKEGNTHLLFRGLCIFDLDEQHQLFLSLNDIAIHATVIRFTRKERTPDRHLCMTIRDELYTALSEISDCLCPGSELEICIKCKESSPLTNEGLHSVCTLRNKDELRCSTHKGAHCVESKELLGFWEEDKKKIAENVLPQHSTLPSERFARISSLVLDVGSQVLGELLTCCTTAPNYTLDQYMKANEPQIRQLQKRKVLTQDQLDIIFPPSGQTDINKYDITLASALLNNIYPSLGQQEKQLIIDLRTQRNELAHSISTKMSEQDFLIKWTKVQTILTDLCKLCKDPNVDSKVQKEILDIQMSGSCAIIAKLTTIREELKKVSQLLEDIKTT